MNGFKTSVSGRLILLASLVLGLSIFNSCSYSYEYNTVETKNFTIDFPDFMTSAADKKLSEGAALQYANFFRNIYTVVNEIEKKDGLTLESLAEQKFKALTKQLERPQEINNYSKLLNGKNAHHFELTGTVGNDEINERIYYYVTLVEDENRFYELSLWTWDSWREKYVKDFPKIENSFTIR